MEFQENVPLAPYTTFGIGGPARWFAEARSEGDLVEAAAFAREAGLPLFALGGGSNLLVSDQGYRGVVLRIALAGIEEERRGSSLIFSVAAGEDWDAFVDHAVAKDCGGIECLAGIPGTAGGTPVQNVGAYGQEVAQTIHMVRAFDQMQSDFVDLAPEQCGFSYRRSRFNSFDAGRFLVCRVDFSLEQGRAPSIEYEDLIRYFKEHNLSCTLGATSRAVRVIRKSKGMVISPSDPDSRSAGSFFKNPIVAMGVYERIAAGFSPAPVPHYPAPADDTGRARVKLPAAWLLEKAGFHRGLIRGRAGISSRHTLALINRGDALAADILRLRDEIIAGVEEQFNVRLEAEPVWLE
ncbi:MAG TPA: UDP-N-acetylmuramate dehydrogenase [Acidobacteriaceae bacterium]